MAFRSVNLLGLLPIDLTRARGTDINVPPFRMPGDPQLPVGNGTAYSWPSNEGNAVNNNWRVASMGPKLSGLLTVRVWQADFTTHYDYVNVPWSINPSETFPATPIGGVGPDFTGGGAGGASVRYTDSIVVGTIMATKTVAPFSYDAVNITCTVNADFNGIAFLWRGAGMTDTDGNYLGDGDIFFTDFTLDVSAVLSIPADYSMIAENEILEDFDGSTSGAYSGELWTSQWYPFLDPTHEAEIDRSHAGSLQGVQSLRRPDHGSANSSFNISTALIGIKTTYPARADL